MVELTEPKNVERLPSGSDLLASPVTSGGRSGKIRHGIHIASSDPDAPSTGKSGRRKKKKKEKDELGGFGAQGSPVEQLTSDQIEGAK